MDEGRSIESTGEPYEAPSITEIGSVLDVTQQVPSVSSILP